MVGVVFEEMIEKVVALVADDIPSGGLGAPFAQARLIATRESICVSIYPHTEGEARRTNPFVSYFDIRACL